jgi:hypothetical protein
MIKLKNADRSRAAGDLDRFQYIGTDFDRLESHKIIRSLLSNAGAPVSVTTVRGLLVFALHGLLSAPHCGDMGYI